MSPYPVCVIGVGPAGRNYLLSLLKDWRVRVVGFVNRSEDRRRKVAAETGVPGFASLDELLAGAKERPQMAVIASANVTHKDFTLECLAKGLHVFCEKPMAMSLADCETMVAAERASGRVLQIGFEYRYGSMTERLRQLQIQGAFGELKSIEAFDSRGHWWPERPDTPVADVWHLNREVGGGPLIHCGIHQLDLLRYYGGEISQVAAFVPPRSLSFYPADIPDHFTLQVRFASGSAGCLSVWHSKAPTWYRPSPPWVPQYNKVPGHYMDLVVTGTGGAAMAELYGEQMHIMRYDLANRETVYERSETFHHHNPSRTHHDTPGMIVRFALNLIAGKGAMHSAQDSLITTRLGIACEEAVQEAIRSGWTSGIRTL